MTVVKYRGGWRYRCKYKDSFGRIHEKSKTGFKKKSDALKAEQIFKEKQVKKAKYEDISCIELINEYKETLSMKIKESTVSVYKNRINKHILPYFQKLYLSDIDAKLIFEWKKELNDMGFSLSYKQNIYSILADIIDLAILLYNYPGNVVRKCGNFKDPNYIKKDIKIWNYQEFQIFSNNLPQETWRDYIFFVFYNFLYFTGCRRGEAMAIQWKDISENYDEVKIGKTCSNKIKGKDYVLLKPKTKSSIRIVTIPKKIQKMLKTIWEHDNDRLDFRPDKFVFGYQKPLKDTTVESRKNRCCELSGLEKIRIHDFRHCHASFLISKNVNIVEVSKRLGHSDITMTLNTYSHLMPRTKDKIVGIFDEIDEETLATKKEENSETDE